MQILLFAHLTSSDEGSAIQQNNTVTNRAIDTHKDPNSFSNVLYSVITTTVNDHGVPPVGYSFVVGMDMEDLKARVAGDTRKERKVVVVNAQLATCQQDGKGLHDSEQQMMKTDRQLVIIKKRGNAHSTDSQPTCTGNGRSAGLSVRLL